MVRIDELAEAALAGDALALRSLAQEWLAQNECLADAARPTSSDPIVLVISAGLAELLAERRNEPAPRWTREIGAAARPLYLLKSAQRMPRLRTLCENESPPPLRRRNLLAPPTFLQFV